MSFEVVAVLLLVAFVGVALVLLMYLLVAKRVRDPFQGVFALAKQGDRVARAYYGFAAAAGTVFIALVAKLIIVGK